MNMSGGDIVNTTTNVPDYKQWAKEWVRTGDDQNCGGQACPSGTFCMRPALYGQPMHCVHTDAAANVADALAQGQTLIRCDQAGPMLMVAVLFLIFLVQLAHLCFSCRYRRRPSPSSPSLQFGHSDAFGHLGQSAGADCAVGGSSSNGQQQDKFGGAHHHQLSLGVSSLLDQQEMHPLIMLQNNNSNNLSSATYHPFQQV